MKDGSSRSPPQAFSLSVPAHLIPVEQVAQYLQTDSESGLSDSEVVARYERYGPNAVIPSSSKLIIVGFG
jgi:Cation transporter/ATPase, N-terminus